MTNVIFYRISGALDSAILLACQLTEKAFKQNMSVLIHTTEEATSEIIDKKLWDFSATAFLPHQIEGSPVSTISISHHSNPGDHDDLLINLSGHSTPDWFSRFKKVIEIVYDEQQVTEKKRVRYGFYQSRGYPVRYHDLTKTN